MTGWQPFFFEILSITACVLPRKVASNDIEIYGTEQTTASPVAGRVAWEMYEFARMLYSRSATGPTAPPWRSGLICSLHATYREDGGNS